MASRSLNKRYRNGHEYLDGHRHGSRHRYGDGRRYRDARRFPGTALAAVLLVTTGAATAGAATAGATSTAESSRWVVEVYAEGIAGKELLHGNFAAAATKLGSRQHKPQLEALTTSTNRCVALTMTKQWQAAQVACDEAIETARNKDIDIPSWLSGGMTHAEDPLALAYSNRAVLHWMLADTNSASRDLARARALSPHSVMVAHNAMLLMSGNPVAMAVM